MVDKAISEDSILIMRFDFLAIEVVAKLLDTLVFSLTPNLLEGIAISIVMLLLFYSGVLLSPRYFPCVIGKQNRFCL